MGFAFDCDADRMLARSMAAAGWWTAIRFSFSWGGALQEAASCPTKRLVANGEMSNLASKRAWQGVAASRYAPSSATKAMSHAAHGGQRCGPGR